MPTINLEDYTQKPFHLTDTHLTIQLDKTNTKVKNIMQFKRRDNSQGRLVLDGGSNIHLDSIYLNGVALLPADYKNEDGKLTILNDDLPNDFTITLSNHFSPQDNTDLSGIYRSDDVYISQCESEGFRRITWFYDAPDNLAKYKTTIVANQKENPLLLSNGNLINEGVDVQGNHYATFEDPNPKPSYLFAMVAGNLESRVSYYHSDMSGSVKIQVAVPYQYITQVEHAIHVLKCAMQWNEQQYGLPYDLNSYNIVGASSFNAGAMENKGLNIFNASCLLADKDYVTDATFANIWRVVGHEFFHNYAGNRVTVRDWFQLSLKEGLATYLEQEFKADMIGFTLPRIETVVGLRTRQFPEDASPMAHPVLFTSYDSIGNYYDMTTYLKGAELLTMLSGLLGKQAFREGIKDYFKIYDGKAATIDQFLHTMSNATGKDLTQFKRWYTQSGTPAVTFSEDYDPIHKRYFLTVEQSCLDKDGNEKPPQHIPIKMGLLDIQGNEIPLQLFEGDGSKPTQRVLELTKNVQTFVFENIPHHPTPSLMRDFSAPVKITESMLTDKQKYFLMANDTNAFNRWESAQQVGEKLIAQALKAHAEHRPFVVPNEYLKACDTVLKSDMAHDLKAAILSLPTKTQMLAQMPHFDPDALNKAYDTIIGQVTKHQGLQYKALYNELKGRVSGDYTPENAAVRDLSNFCLARLVKADVNSKNKDMLDAVKQQYNLATNLTDRLAALGALAGLDQTKFNAHSKEVFDKINQDFATRAANSPQLYEEWLPLQAVYNNHDTLEHINKIYNSDSFKKDNPNHVRELLRVFMRANHSHFHKADGSGYAFIATKVIELNDINKDMASHLTSILVKIPNLDEKRRHHLYNALKQIDSVEGLCNGVKENVSKGLASLEDVKLSEKVIEQASYEPASPTTSPRKARGGSFVSRLSGYLPSFGGGTSPRAASPRASAPTAMAQADTDDDVKHSPRIN